MAGQISSKKRDLGTKTLWESCLFPFQGTVMYLQNSVSGSLMSLSIRARCLIQGSFAALLKPQPEG